MVIRPSVNSAKCGGCLHCVDVCPINFARAEDGKARAVEGPFCAECGHCAAVCATGAIAHPGLAASGFERIAPDARLPYGRLLPFLKMRRSRREFKDERVPREAIEKLLAAAVQAPNSCNRQDVRYTVITDRALLKRISAKISSDVLRLVRLMDHPAGRLFFRIFRRKEHQALEPFMPLMEAAAQAAAGGMDVVLYSAPCLILVSAPKGDPCGPEDAVYCAANIQLAAEALGLGTCVIGFVTEPCRGDASIRRMCRVPEGYEVKTSLIVGVPKFPYPASVPKLPPKAEYFG